MTTVILGDPPAEFAEYLERRQEQGQDLYDEVWEGVYYVSPVPNLQHGLIQDALTEILGPAARRAGLTSSGPFNLGEQDDYRVPDKGYHRNPTDRTWVETAAIVVEVVSPADKSYAKFDHYAAHGVDEVIIVDPMKQAVVWFALVEGGYIEVDQSPLTSVNRLEIADALNWSPVGG